MILTLFVHFDMLDKYQKVVQPPTSHLCLIISFRLLFMPLFIHLPVLSLFYSPRQWRWPFSYMEHRCDPLESYLDFIRSPCCLGSAPRESAENRFPSGECMLIDGTCQFNSNAPAIASKFFHRLFVAILCTCTFAVLFLCHTFYPT